MNPRLAAVAACSALALAACAGGTGSPVAPLGPWAQTRTSQSSIGVLPGATASPGSSFVVLPGPSPTPQANLPPAQTGNFQGNTSDPFVHTHLVQNTLIPIVRSIPNAVDVPGYHPADLLAAYGLATQSMLRGGLVAVVDAFDHPFAESDLAVYRAMFGLRPCLSLTGCFHKVSSGTRLPAINAAWALEIALDLEMVSAICPNCSILLVEANSDRLKDLAAAENLAASYHPQAISNSFYVSEAELKTDYSSAFIHPGIAITAASGDGGIGANFPADIPQVTAVGGTYLTRSANARGWEESPWSGTGYGCSTAFAKPTWQSGGCATRSIPDVAALADPASGVAVFSTVAPGGAAGWMVLGGTSVGAPMIAAIYALAAGGSAAPGAYAAQLGLGAPQGIAAF